MEKGQEEAQLTAATHASAQHVRGLYDVHLMLMLYRYLHGVVCKNPTVTEQNRALLVETLRSISEILIWGDQNDSSVFE